MKTLIYIAVAWMTASACGTSAADVELRSTPSSSGTSTTPATSPPPTIPVTTTTVRVAGDAELALDGVSYRLDDDPSGCVAVTITVEGINHYGQASCETRWSWTEHIWCAAFEQDQTTTTQPGTTYSRPPTTCLVEVPPVTIGRIVEGLGCLATVSNGRIGPVSFQGEGLFIRAMSRDRIDQLLLASYTIDGRIQNDGFGWQTADAMVTLCERAGPWQTAPIPTQLHIVWSMDPSLVDTSAGFFTDFGAIPEGFNFSAGGHPILYLPTELYTDSSHVRIGLFVSDSTFENYDLGVFEFPPDVLAELSSGWFCRDAWGLQVEIGADILDGDPGAISLTAIPMAEINRLEGFVIGLASDRPAGAPCPDTGIERSGPSVNRDGPTVLANVSITCVVDESWLALGASESLYIFLPEANNGVGLDLGILATTDDEPCGFGGFVGPGAFLELGIGPTEGDPTDPGLVRLSIPPLPDDLTAHNGEYFELAVMIGPGHLEPPRLDESTIVFKWIAGVG